MKLEDLLKQQSAIPETLKYGIFLSYSDKNIDSLLDEELDRYGGIGSHDTIIVIDFKEPKTFMTLLDCYREEYIEIEPCKDGFQIKETK